MRSFLIILLAVILLSPPPAGARNLTDEDLALIERRVFEGVNDARTQNRMPPLRFDAAVQRTAASHAQDMATRRYFSHDSPDGRTPGQRASDAGIDYANYTENILRVTQSADSPSKLAQTIVDGFLANDWHRFYLLKPNITRTGVAVTRSGNGQILAVQDFLETYEGMDDYTSASVDPAPAPAARKKNKRWQKPAAIAVGAYVLYRLWKRKH